MLWPLHSRTRRANGSSLVPRPALRPGTHTHTHSPAPAATPCPLPAGAPQRPPATARAAGSPGGARGVACGGPAAPDGCCWHRWGRPLLLVHRWGQRCCCCCCCWAAARRGCLCAHLTWLQASGCGSEGTGCACVYVCLCAGVPAESVRTGCYRAVAVCGLPEGWGCACWCCGCSFEAVAAPRGASWSRRIGASCLLACLGPPGACFPAATPWSRWSRFSVSMGAGMDGCVGVSAKTRARVASLLYASNPTSHEWECQRRAWSQQEGTHHQLHPPYQATASRCARGLAHQGLRTHQHWRSMSCPAEPGGLGAWVGRVCERACACVPGCGHIAANAALLGVPSWGVRPLPTSSACHF